jgi:hypothetical protein
MDIVLLLHLLAAATWLGGLLMLGVGVLAVLIVLASAGHVIAGRRTDSQPLIIASRTLAAFILVATVVVFYLGIRVAG